MDSASRIETSLSPPAPANQPEVELRASAKIAGERRERDRLRTAWTAVFVAYAGAAVPLLGWAVAHAL
jgi:hypothetical protein